MFLALGCGVRCVWSTYFNPALHVLTGFTVVVQLCLVADVFPGHQQGEGRLSAPLQSIHADQRPTGLFQSSMRPSDTFMTASISQTPTVHTRPNPAMVAIDASVLHDMQNTMTEIKQSVSDQTDIVRQLVPVVGGARVAARSQPKKRNQVLIVSNVVM